MHDRTNNALSIIEIAETANPCNIKTRPLYKDRNNERMDLKRKNMNIERHTADTFVS